MDTLREQMHGTAWVVAAIAFILGLAIGLGYAWGINPVEWTDATPDLLREDLRVDYLRMAIDSYSVNKDVDQALERYQRLDEHADDALQQVAASPGEVEPTAIQNFSAVVEIMEEPGQQEGPTEEGEPVETEEAVGEVTAEPEEERPVGSTAMRLILPVCGATLVLGLLLIGALYMRNRLGQEDEEAFLEPGFDMEEEYEEDFEAAYQEEGFEDEF
ncbi:MAG: hypothetical protein ACLFWD_12695, partial [Anaerolineales bacterium]